MASRKKSTGGTKGLSTRTTKKRAAVKKKVAAQKNIPNANSAKKTAKKPVKVAAEMSKSRKPAERKATVGSLSRATNGKKPAPPPTRPKMDQQPASFAPQEQTKPRGFAQHVHGLPKPNEPHPGHTAAQGNTHNRPGSQPERVRHLYPNGNRPNSGSARSAQYKGKRRDNMSQG